MVGKEMMWLNDNIDYNMRESVPIVDLSFLFASSCLAWLALASLEAVVGRDGETYDTPPSSSLLLPVEGLSSSS